MSNRIEAQAGFLKATATVEKLKRTKRIASLLKLPQPIAYKVGVSDNGVTYDRIM